MNREIKFRAWNTHTKTMIDLKKITPLALDPNIGECDGLFLPFQNVYELMEFTGLKDINGKDIYEGDIVDLHPDKKDKIWHRLIIFDTAAFHCKQIHGDANHPLLFTKHTPHLGWVIIGNIYETPELLNPQDKDN